LRTTAAHNLVRMSKLVKGDSPTDPLEFFRSLRKKIDECPQFSIWKLGLSSNRINIRDLDMGLLGLVRDWIATNPDGEVNYINNKFILDIKCAREVTIKGTLTRDELVTICNTLAPIGIKSYEVDAKMDVYARLKNVKYKLGLSSLKNGVLKYRQPERVDFSKIEGLRVIDVGWMDALFTEALKLKDKVALVSKHHQHSARDLELFTCYFYPTLTGLGGYVLNPQTDFLEGEELFTKTDNVPQIAKLPYFKVMDEKMEVARRTTIMFTNSPERYSTMDHLPLHKFRVSPNQLILYAYKCSIEEMRSVKYHNPKRARLVIIPPYRDEAATTYLREMGFKITFSRNVHRLRGLTWWVTYELVKHRLPNDIVRAVYNTLIF